MSRILSYPRVTALVVGMMTMIASMATACPNCTEDIAKSNPNLADGLSYSMIGMASMPFLLFGSVAFFLVRKYGRGNRSVTGISPEEAPRWN